MKKETSLCMGCMADTKQNSDDICAVCGYAGGGVFLSSYLAPKTFLANRYIVGKLISYNGEGALYMAFDTHKNARITVREYMPDTLCGRKKESETIEVNPQYVALYKTYLSEFLELNRLLMSVDRDLRIQKVSDVFVENNTAYAVYEYIAGISLKTYLSNLGGVLPWEQVRELFAPLFTTLNIVHSAGVIHRGISPSTILFNDRSELVLINFGIAESRTHGYEINHEVYTGYAGPEQYSDVEKHGTWTDVYGVAAVLYKVLTGQMPADAVARRKEDTLIAPALINRNIPPSVSSAIMNALVLDAGQRTRTIGLFIDQLFEAAPMNIPDSTNEILIKKPLRPAETENAQNAKTSQTANVGSGASLSKTHYRKYSSNAAAVTVCIMLGLVLATFVTVMVLSASNPDLFKGFVPDAAVNAEEIMNPGSPAALVSLPADDTAETDADTAETEQNPIDDNDAPPQSNELYVVPDFTSRYFEVIQNNNAFVFLTFIPIYEFNDEYDQGLIFEQDKPHGSEVVKGAEITVKVSKGPETAILPPFEGKSLSEYQDLLSAAKIKFEKKGEYNAAVKKDDVIRCNVKAGDVINIAEGDIVTVYYSLGAPPETTTVATTAAPRTLPVFDELIPEDDYEW